MDMYCWKSENHEDNMAKIECISPMEYFKMVLNTTLLHTKRNFKQDIYTNIHIYTHIYTNN